MAPNIRFARLYDARRRVKMTPPTADEPHYVLVEKGRTAMVPRRDFEASIRRCAMMTFEKRVSQLTQEERHEVYARVCQGWLL